MGQPKGAARGALSDLLLVALTFGSGAVDAISFLGLGRVFTANMTGNIVLLGFGIAGSRGLPVIAPVSSLAAFLLGCLIGGALVRQLQKRHPALVARALAIETSVITIAAVVAAVATVRPGGAAAYAVIVLLACAMGVRSTTIRHIGVPDLSTVVLTMTLTALASESRVGGGSGNGSVRRLAAVTAMFAGAVSGALLLKTSIVIPLSLAAGLALATWLVYVPAALRLGRPHG
jgi:uncharacterized membrane protein YoaK (UPF0700 family)